jgi:hypothetical protein
MADPNFSSDLSQYVKLSKNYGLAMISSINILSQYCARVVLRGKGASARAGETWQKRQEVRGYPRPTFDLKRFGRASYETTSNKARVKAWSMIELCQFVDS